MKCKIFYGRMDTVAEDFNKWAKGKMLVRDVIIHTIAFPTYSFEVEDMIAIIVFHPDDPFWDKVEE